MTEITAQLSTPLADRARLVEGLRRINAVRHGAGSDHRESVDRLVREFGLGSAGWASRLVVYGSLAPGKSNHHQMAGMHGSWSRVTVRGRLLAAGWGTALGYPGFIWDEVGGESIEALLFTSPDLPDHWDRLDHFEGQDYRRILVPALLAGELVPANIYEIKPPAPGLESWGAEGNVGGR